MNVRPDILPRLRVAGFVSAFEIDGLVRTVVGIETRLSRFRRQLDYFWPAEPSSPGHPHVSSQPKQGNRHA